jgi:ATP-dependent RNA helicase DDX27
LDSKSQEAALRNQPDVIIATPGRLVDHLLNAPTFNLQTVEILILDEADRMLDEHFMEQMNEIIKLCPQTRQTMLFSATMTDNVQELVRLSLNKPVKLFVDSNIDVADNLQQEFVRIRQKMEDSRPAVITALCCRSFKEQCLVFFQTKRLCHRMRVVFGLLGLKVEELHGSLSQIQRLEALQKFKDGEVDYLLATDLAARGLDITGVKTVVNYSMPSTLKQYIHRVGRTARAGRAGLSVTLVGEKERKVLKEVVKQAKCPVKSRVVPSEVIAKYRKKVEDLEEEVKEILKEEEEDKQMRLSEMEISKAQNMIDHEKEIFSRPARAWIAKETNGHAPSPSSSLPPVVKDKESRKKGKPTKKEGDKEQEYTARVAKRDRKRKRMRAYAETPDKSGGKRKGVCHAYHVGHHLFLSFAFLILSCSHVLMFLCSYSSHC